MRTKKKAAHASSRDASPRTSVVLTKGDWLDVMDHDGVWNVARVLSVPSPEEVEVMYDGWPEEYDEVVRVDSDRVAPYHTFTWAVKCWVKYLNWPMWPSVISIRTPGTKEGIKNLEMEDRLYVDFLDGPDFAKRDRCWQKKRQVKTFDDNYDKHRMGTNGAQFERALEFVLRSDATTKMPTFAKGTLPMQYERSTTESVERMRKNMGNALWYRHFANNKERHMQTHIYETIGDDEEGSTSDESISIPKLKIRRPRTTPLSEEQHVLTPTKKKRSLPAKKKHSSVKIEKEPLDEVEVPYDSEAMNSSDDESDRKRELDFLKKRRQLRTRRADSLVDVSAQLEKLKRSSPTQGTNAAPSMPRHITVTMDEIIADDDDDDSEGSVGGPKKTSKSPRRLGKRRTRTSITPTCVKKENGGHSKSPIYELKVHNNMSSTEKTSPLSRPHVRRRKVNGSARLHKEAWNGLFSGNTLSTTATNEIGESDDVASDAESVDNGFDLDDVPTSPISMTDDYNRTGTKNYSSDPAKSTWQAKPGIRQHVTSPHPISKKNEKGQIKMTASWSIPPLSERLSLAASAKPRSVRTARLLADDEDWENEQKGVPGNAAELDEKPVDKHHIKQLNKKKQGKRIDSVGHSTMLRQTTSRMRKEPMPLIDQRIAFANEVLRNLDKEKRRASKAIADTDQPKLARNATRHNGSQPKTPGTKTMKPCNFEDMDQTLGDAADNDGEGRLVNAPLVLNLQPDQLNHSYLSVDKTYMSDSQESKGVSTPFDEEEAKSIPCTPNERKAKAKAQPKATDAVELKPMPEEKMTNPDEAEEKKSQEVRRHFCVMQAGLGGMLEVPGGVELATEKTTKTVISMPRKFDKPVKGMSHVSTGPVNSMLRNSQPPLEKAGDHLGMTLTSRTTTVFSSSEGFSMEKWFMRTLIANYRSDED